MVFSYVDGYSVHVTHVKYEKVKYDSILANRIAYQLDVFNF